MREVLNEMIRLTGRVGTEPTETMLPGVLLIGGDVPEHQLAALYQPMIGFLIQGRKTIWIGSHSIEMTAPSYFVIPMELPVTGRTEPDPTGLPYLSAGLLLNEDSILDLLDDLPGASEEHETADDFSACVATPEFLDAWLRLLRLLETPEHIPALAPAYEREILYRVLLGPQGWRLRQLCLARGRGPSINKAIPWIRDNYTGLMEIKSLADRAGMSVTTFHRQFKRIAGLSPLQFQKQLRLLEARKLLAFGGYSASHAAFEVGYESVSQFNREYSRFFGAPPARDAARVRGTEVRENSG